MRAVIQRVSKASCTVDGKITGKIEQGLLVLLGIENEDSLADIQWLAKKIINLRIFNDEQGLMNRSLLDIDGNILLISQFTLLAATKKGIDHLLSAQQSPILLFHYTKRCLLR